MTGLQCFDKFAEAMTGVFSRAACLMVGRGLALALVGVLLTLAPFAAALEIHHELAAADHDGHEHSDSDLCQWVQHHIGQSLSSDVPTLVALIVPDVHPLPAPVLLVSATLTGSGASRAPPRS